MSGYHFSVKFNKNYIKKSLSRVLATLGALVLLIPAIATASTTTPQQFTDPASQPGDNFGISVSLSSDGSVAVVGAPSTNTTTGFQNAGAAYVFVNSNGSWGAPVATLAPSDQADNDSFGNSVNITPDGSKIIIGAYHGQGSTTPGKAYIFNQPSGGWSSGNPIQQSELSASDSQSNDSQATNYYGWSVVLSGDGLTALVGSKFHGPNTNEGAAYLYKTTAADNWGGTPSETILQPSDATAYGLFGFSVALSQTGSTALVGAPADGSPTPGGNVYEYSEPVDGWSSNPTVTETTQLQHTQGSNDDFGLSVTLTSDGTMAAVGAPGQTVNDSSGNPVGIAGASYIFGNSGGTWAQTDVKTDLNPVQFDKYGWSSSFAADGSSLLIGSINANQSGTVYKYLPNGDGTWRSADQFVPATNDPNQNYGWSVSVINDTDSDPATNEVFIGAPAFDSSTSTQANGSIASGPITISSLTTLNTTSTTTEGAAYIYDLTPPSISNFSPSTAGVGASVTINGDHLTGATVNFNGTTASIVSNNGTIIQTTVPTGATTGPINVVTPNGTASTSTFTVNPIHVPIVTSFTPSAQGEGQKVTIKGKYLGSATVTWNGEPATVVSTNLAKTAIGVLLPLNAVSGYPLVVSTPSGTAQTAPVTVLAPSITSLSTTSTKVGGKITIKGANMAGVTQVRFNGGGVTTTPIASHNASVSVKIPVGATSGTVTVIAPSGSATSSAILTIQ